MLSPYSLQSNSINHLICEPASRELLISVIGNREFRIAELIYYSESSFQGEAQTLLALPTDWHVLFMASTEKIKEIANDSIQNNTT